MCHALSHAYVAFPNSEENYFYFLRRCKRRRMMIMISVFPNEYFCTRTWLRIQDVLLSTFTIAISIQMETYYLPYFLFLSVSLSENLTCYLSRTRYKRNDGGRWRDQRLLEHVHFFIRTGNRFASFSQLSWFRFVLRLA